jgi:hypothetical protein
MEFLNPAALYGLLALPLLLLPYLLRRKARRVVFSSLLLLSEASGHSSSRPWGKIRLPWIFFLQLLLLALLIFALSEPVFSVRPALIAVVLDNSASMQAMENDKTRFALGQEKAREVINDLGGTGQVDLFLITPRMEKLRAKPMSPSEALRAVGTLEAYDLGEPPVDYDQTLNQLARQRDYQRVYLITDRVTRGQTATVKVISVGRPQANFALIGFQVRRSSLLDARLEAHLEVANFSGKDEKLKIAVKSPSATLAAREISVASGKTAAVSFDRISEHPYYQAEIESRDPLMLDNRRFAVAPPSRDLRILGISPRPKELSSLRSIPGVQLDIVAPNEYEKAEHGSYGLEIFHFAAPATLPLNPALFILPPRSSTLVDLGAPIANAHVSSWREPHVLTRYVNFSLFRPAYARPLMPQTVGEVVIESAQGVLAFASERQGARYLILGFDPLPYLGRENLPMSIFTLNFLDWFFESGRTSQATGEPILLGSIQAGDSLTTPQGEKISLKAGYSHFSGTFRQGIYQLGRGAKREFSARNLLDSNESDLRAPLSIDLRGTSPSAAGSSRLFSLWPYLLIAAILLLFIEWFANPRRASLQLRRGSAPLG